MFLFVAPGDLIHFEFGDEGCDLLRLYFADMAFVEVVRVDHAVARTTPPRRPDDSHGGAPRARAAGRMTFTSGDQGRLQRRSPPGHRVGGGAAAADGDGEVGPLARMADERDRLNLAIGIVRSSSNASAFLSELLPPRDLP